MPGLAFAPVASQAPTKITFEILEITCGGGTISHEFFLNSTSLGTFLGDNSQCTCTPPLQTFIVDDAAVLAAAWNSGGSFEGTPVFFGCSDVDAHVPKTRVDESAAVFARLGADVTKAIYPGMGHFVNDDEIAVAQRLLDRLAERRQAK